MKASKRTLPKVPAFPVFLFLSFLALCLVFTGDLSACQKDSARPAGTQTLAAVEGSLPTGSVYYASQHDEEDVEGGEEMEPEMDEGSDEGVVGDDESGQPVDDEGDDEQKKEEPEAVDPEQNL